MRLLLKKSPPLSLPLQSLEHLVELKGFSSPDPHSPCLEDLSALPKGVFTASLIKAQDKCPGRDQSRGLRDVGYAEDIGQEIDGLIPDPGDREEIHERPDDTVARHRGEPVRQSPSKKGHSRAPHPLPPEDRLSLFSLGDSKGLCCSQHIPDPLGKERIPEENAVGSQHSLRVRGFSPAAAVDPEEREACTVRMGNEG